MLNRKEAGVHAKKDFNHTLLCETKVGNGNAIQVLRMSLLGHVTPHWLASCFDVMTFVPACTEEVVISIWTTYATNLRIGVG